MKNSFLDAPAAVSEAAFAPASGGYPEKRRIGLYIIPPGVKR